MPDSTQSSTDPSLPAMEEHCVTEEYFTFEHVHDCLEPDLNSENDLTQLEHKLPLHERCAAHTLNLVSSSDIDESLSTSTLSKNIYRSSITKCTALRKKASQSMVASNAVQETVKQKLLLQHVRILILMQ